MVSLTILAPFIGYLIIFNHYIIDFLRISSEIFSNIGDVNALSSGISRMRQLYIGLVLIGIASILFKACCPAPISRHRDLYDYVESELKVVTADRFLALQDRLRKLRSWGRVEWEEKIDAILGLVLQKYRVNLAQQQLLVWEGWINENRLTLTSALTISYELENEARAIARWFVAVFYITGFLCLAWSSLIIFVRVVYSLTGPQ
jgi:hypothetical protein